MGYRSEVALALRKKDYEELLAKASMFEEEDKRLDSLVNFLKFPDELLRDNSGHVVLHWDWIKWYDEGDDPLCTWVMENLPDIYHFVRIGEDNDDTDEHSSSMGYDDEESDDEIESIIGFQRSVYLGPGLVPTKK